MVDKTHISLAELPVNDHAKILSFSGGHSMVNRLAALGFTPGTDVDMAQNYGHGPLIVLVRGTRVALGRGEASKILVERSQK